MKVFTWNVKGLKSPNKRMQTLRHLKRLRPDVAMLQETHLWVEDLQRMHKLWVGTVYGSPAKGGKAEVITLIHKNFPHTNLT